MKIRTKARETPSGVLYLTDLKRTDIKFFGKPPATIGLHTIIGVEGPILTAPDGFLEFAASDAVPLNVGSGTDVYLVELGESTLAVPPETHIHTFEEVENLINSGGYGDQAFLAACKAEKIPASIQLLSDKLLENIRLYSEDVLIEGKNRKWYTKPNNFLALTIQNTKKRVCVQVKDTPILNSLENIEVHRDKRYVRLFLEKESQLPDILKAIRASYLHA